MNDFFNASMFSKQFSKKTSDLKACVKNVVLAFLLSLCSGFAMANAGFFKQFVVIDRGTIGNEYFGNGLSNFAINLGTFCQNGTFILRGAEANTFQDGNDNVTCDVFCPRMWYRIYPTASPSGGFNSVGLFFRSADVNNKKWDVLDANINLLNGLGAGNYTMEVYFEGNAVFPPSGNFDFFDSNGGSNYKATFTVTANPTLGTYGPASLVSGGNTTITPSAAPTNTTSLVAYTNSNFSGLLSADPATGVVTVTNAKQVGIYPVTIMAASGSGCISSSSASLTVSDPACTSGQFGMKTNFGVGSGPLFSAVGDFNADGNQDLVVVNSSSDNVSILLGNGLGGFGTATNFGVGDNPSSVAVGDFNGDGMQDLSVTNSNTDNVSILLGTGGGIFAAAVNFGVGDLPRYVSVGDFNGDGKQDLSVANNNSNNVSILLGNGMGGFGSPSNFGVGLNPQSIAVGDFNEDGNNDLAVANRFSNHVSILFGNGTGGFGTATNLGVASGTGSVAVGDFNEDGHQDISVVHNTFNTSTNVSILLGTGTGTFGAVTTFGADLGPRSVVVGDYNGDGNQDLAVSNGASNNVSILFGNGMGSFGSATQYGVGATSETMAVGDFNNDGTQDLSVPHFYNANISVLLGSAVACLQGAITGATTVNCYSDFTIKLTATPSGGMAPYTYLWSTGQSGAVINNAGAGTYSVTITDGIGQTKVVNHTITGPTAVSATLVITNQKCEDPAKGTIVATAIGGTPGYEYALDFGAWQNSGTFTIVPTGWHTINIKDENGCQGKVSALVTKLASSMTLSAVRTGISSCGGTGIITATAGGGVAPYQYKLGEAGTYQSSGTFSGLAAGTYSIFAKDNIGCTVKRNYTVVDNGKDAFEPNNDRSRANTIIVSQPVIARIGTATDQDWFKFNVGAGGGDFDITFSHVSVSYTVKLFNNAGGLLATYNGGTGTQTYTTPSLPGAATYRIQVTGTQSFVCYNMMVAPSAPPIMFGAEMLTSTTVAPDELKAQAFPNPHRGSIVLQVESPVTGKGSIVLYDLQGRTMVTREENLRAGTNQVRFSNLQPINYFYRVMVGGKSTSGKVFKQ